MLRTLWILLAAIFLHDMLAGTTQSSIAIGLLITLICFSFFKGVAHLKEKTIENNHKQPASDAELTEYKVNC